MNTKSNDRHADFESFRNARTQAPKRFHDAPRSWSSIPLDPDAEARTVTVRMRESLALSLNLRARGVVK